MKNNSYIYKILIITNDFFKIHYALTLAATIKSSDISCTLFFAGYACHALKKKEGYKSLDINQENFKLIQSGLPGFDEMIKLCNELSISIMICEAGLKLCDINKDEIRNDIKIMSGGLYTFIPKKNSFDTDKLLII
tara:strand:+ start:22 stop:429 length:408 start_codon:yes stop_codon:yes gene_type:complete